MLNPSSPLARLIAAPMRPGIVCWLGIRPARHAVMRAIDPLVLDPARGVEGDHYAGSSGTRHVTLIMAEHIAAIGSVLGRIAAPQDVRRNVVVSGLNLAALKGCRIRIGAALIEATGECHPCSRMEQILGPGGYNAVRGHGGLTARVLERGEVRVGDAVARA